MLAFLLAGLACAPHVAEPPSVASGNPLLLWRVERDGKVSHLLGTCHAGVTLDYALPAPQDAALAGARIVYTEVAIGDADPVAMTRLAWVDRPTLSQRLAPEDWRAFAVMARDTLPAPMLDHISPALLAASVPILAKSGHGAAGPKPPTMMDVEVQRRAEALGIPQAHVETLEQQVAVLSKNAEHFLPALRPGEGIQDDEAKALADICLRGDASAIEAIVARKDRATRAFYAERNRAWVPVLLPDLSEGGAFVAVGAGHMVGRDGLIEALRRRGFTVTQLTTDRPAVATEGKATHVPVPPPYPPYVVGSEAAFATRAATAVCADGQPARTCIEPDAARCVARVTADAELCIRQYADLFPEDASDAADPLWNRLAACIPAGLIVDAVVHDRVGDAPECAPLVAWSRDLKSK